MVLDLLAWIPYLLSTTQLYIVRQLSVTCGVCVCVRVQAAQEGRVGTAAGQVSHHGSAGSRLRQAEPQHEGLTHAGGHHEGGVNISCYEQQCMKVGVNISCYVHHERGSMSAAIYRSTVGQYQPLCTAQIWVNISCYV